MIIAVGCESYVFGCKCMKKIFSYIAKSMTFLYFSLAKERLFCVFDFKSTFFIVFCSADAAYPVFAAPKARATFYFFTMRVLA